MFSTSSRLSGTGWWLWPTKPVTDGRVAYGGPGLVGQVHPHQHVAGEHGALDQLALAVLDLRDLLGRHDHLVDVVLHVQRGDPVLEVGLHPVLHAGVGVHDEPVALLLAQGGAELLERVAAARRRRPRRLLGRLGGLGLARRRAPRQRPRRPRRRPAPRPTLEPRSVGLGGAVEVLGPVSTSARVSDGLGRLSGSVEDGSSASAAVGRCSSYCSDTITPSSRLARMTSCARRGPGSALLALRRRRARTRPCRRPRSSTETYAIITSTNTSTTMK